MMRKVISCAYLENVQTMELRYTDVTLNNIDCMDVEGKIARNMNKWSGLKMLFNAGSLTIPKLILDSVEVPISCNYKDGTKTVNFSEMESALTLRASISGSDLDCPGAPRQKKLTPFRFPGFRKSQESSISVSSFFLSETEVSRGPPFRYFGAALFFLFSRDLLVLGSCLMENSDRI